MGSPSLKLFGGFRLRDGAGQEVAIATAKTALLLGYLALQAGKAIPREKLMALLWSDRGQNQARASLRQAILTLRRAFENDAQSPLVVGRESVALDPTAINIDTVRFENFVADGSINALGSALAEYQGDLLEGLRSRDHAFEDFLRGERQRLHGLAVEACTKLLRNQRQAGHSDEAAMTAQRLLRMDPLQEYAHRVLIEHYASKGQAGLARQQYRAYCETLRRELGIEPDAETERLFNRIGLFRLPAGEEPPSGDDARGDVHKEVAERQPADRLGELGIEEPQQVPSQRLERRPLTVMACDLTAPAALAGRLDPEDLIGMVGESRSRLVDVVTSLGGFVAQFPADGLVAYFGYPHAHEDDAERAVRAGLAVIDAVRQLESEREHRIEARVGIATGLVVVADLIDKGSAAIGDAPSLASRLQAAAQPGAVLISASTHRQTGGLFEYRSITSSELRGVPDGMGVFQVLGESAVPGRFEALRTDRTALIGRYEEIEFLVRRWKQAKEREGCVVMLSGEPGIGKSRIVRALQERLEGELHSSLVYFCSPHHENSALFPVIRQLERAAAFEREDSPKIRIDKLKALLAQSSKDLRGDAALLADLLSIPTDDPRHDLSPQRRKEKTLDALLAQLIGQGGRLPALMILEDAHWIDPTSLELLERVVERVPRLPLLVVVTARPEFRSPWTGHPHVATRLLNRLSRREGRAMVEQIAGAKTIPREMVDHIVDRTDGVPLFLEELTKAVLESADLSGEGDRLDLTAPLASRTIPATLHASLLARLDRLPAAKRVAEVGAAIGREFSHELIGAICGASEADLSDSLKQLVRSELLHRRGTPPDAVYVFKHPLVQDAAYSTLMRPARQELHARIASVLEERLPETLHTEPEVLAHHCAQAGLIGKAVEYRRKAGLGAIERSANVEAVAQLHKGLELLASLPAGPERDRQEVGLQLALAGVLVGSRGYAAPEMGQTLARARELCERTGDRSRLAPLLYLQRSYHIVRAELDRARELGEEALRVGEERCDSTAQRTAHQEIAVAAFSAGEFVLAHTHLEKALALYDPERHHHLTFLYGVNPRIGSLSWLSWVLLPLGHPDQALRKGAEAMAHAQELVHLNSVALARHFSSWLHQLFHDAPAALQQSEAQISFCREHGLFFWLAPAHVLHGWAVAISGEPEAGIAELTRGIAAYQATGAELLVPFHLGLHAATLLETGRAIEPALALLSDALARVERTGERSFEAEHHRVRGECLLSLATADQAGAEASFVRALEVARGQSARLWELRAASSLARLWQSQGKISEARDLLAPVYAWFTEGFDTADLRDASALLDTLHTPSVNPKGNFDNVE